LQEAISLAYCNYLIETATNGEEAVMCAEVHRKSLALVVMDLRLPGMDGFEAIRRIRAFAPEVPILALTAYGEILRNAAMGAGATEFSVKGAGKKFIPDLMKTIARLLALTNRRQKADAK
jgi:CheY-like chemotaxis protein